MGPLLDPSFMYLYLKLILIEARNTRKRPPSYQDFAYRFRDPSLEDIAKLEEDADADPDEDEHEGAKKIQP